MRQLRPWAGIVPLLLVSPTLWGQTCAQIKNEIAALQQTLASEQRALANCNSHPGSCTPGQISGFQSAIAIAQQEIAADQAKLLTACAPPPPPSTDHVSLQGMEVVQAIQDLNNSVTLIAGKTTWVRVYLGKLSGTRNVSATLRAVRGSTTTTLTPVAAITVDSSENLTTRRQNWNKSLNYSVPASLISAGTTAFTLGDVADTGTPPKPIVCETCFTPTQVTFLKAPPLVIRAVGLTYAFQPSPAAPIQTVAPRAVDFALLQSWLARAYPAAQVTFSQSSAAVNFALVFGNGLVDCTNANSQLAAIRTSEINAGRDSRTHYIGLVSNQGGFMRGCASAASLVASGPSGPPSGANVPTNAVGDTDATFADWYGGHELGHTFGRAHPGFCPGNTRDDTAFPNPNGQISDAKEDSGAGLDVGDSANSISLAPLWATQTFDIMTYCQQPQWLSAYTYEAVRQKLLAENPGFMIQAPAPNATRTMVVGLSVQVVGTLNLTKRTGSISLVAPVTRAAPSPTPISRAELIVRDSAGNELFRQSAAIQESTDIQPGEDQLALIDVIIPFRDDMAQLDLQLDGTSVAHYSNAAADPPKLMGLKAVPDADAPVASWTVSQVSAGTVTYTVEIQDAANQWTTIATGLADTRLPLSADQAQAVALRVTSANGFRASTPLTISLCSDVMNRLAALQDQIATLQQALDDGEIVASQAAKVRAQIQKLRLSASAVRAQLARCQSPR